MGSGRIRSSLDFGGESLVAMDRKDFDDPANGFADEPKEIEQKETKSTKVQSLVNEMATYLMISPSGRIAMCSYLIHASFPLLASVNPSSLRG